MTHRVLIWSEASLDWDGAPHLVQPLPHLSSMTHAFISNTLKDKGPLLTSCQNSFPRPHVADTSQDRSELRDWGGCGLAGAPVSKSLSTAKLPWGLPRSGGTNPGEHQDCIFLGLGNSLERIWGTWSYIGSCKT